ncbi:MAG: hypothetical protein KGJ60_02810 [Verrucomicrobiota bacterium]|nr:hypothetical protein [Verrucomicrobiota bacterium]
MSKAAQIEAELETLSQAELLEIRNLLDDLIEDDLAFTPEFESAIQQSEREMAEGENILRTKLPGTNRDLEWQRIISDPRPRPALTALGDEIETRLSRPH